MFGIKKYLTDKIKFGYVKEEYIDTNAGGMLTTGGERERFVAVIEENNNSSVGVRFTFPSNAGGMSVKVPSEAKKKYFDLIMNESLHLMTDDEVKEAVEAGQCPIWVNPSEIEKLNKLSPEAEGKPVHRMKAIKMVRDKQKNIDIIEEARIQDSIVD